MRDDRIQAQGRFPTPKGSRLLHEKLVAFIGRNYAPDALGRWFFQNGPQRVYIELETCPWVWRLQRAKGAQWQVSSHTGQPTTVERMFVDDLGRVYLLTSLGIGLVHSQDVLLVSEAMDECHWQLESIDSAALGETFGFVPSPQSLVASTPVSKP